MLDLRSDKKNSPTGFPVFWLLDHRKYEIIIQAAASLKALNNDFRVPPLTDEAPVRGFQAHVRDLHRVISVMLIGLLLLIRDMDNPLDINIQANAVINLETLVYIDTYFDEQDAEMNKLQLGML